jgi:hypothetical protein
MGLYDWIQAYRSDAGASNDSEALRMLALYHAGKGLAATDPQRGLALLGEARALAVRRREPWWPLHIDHWRLQLLLHYLRDVSRALDLAVQAALEVRKPAYDHFPQRVCLQEDLIYAYLFSDPVGYADLIGQALDYMREQTAEDLDCRHCIQSCTTEWHMRCGRLDEAEASARRSLQLADGPSQAHPASGALSDLCYLDHLRGGWNALQGHAEAGEEAARQANRPAAVSEFLLWRAVAARQQGDEHQAQRLMRKAASRAGRLGAAPSLTFYDALRAFHTLGGDLNAALAARGRELEALAGKGQWFQECRARMDRCRLLRRIGRPLDVELAAAREAASRLRRPGPALEELKRIEGGGDGGPAKEST